MLQIFPKPVLDAHGSDALAGTVAFCHCEGLNHDADLDRLAMLQRRREY